MSTTSRVGSSAQLPEIIDLEAENAAGKDQERGTLSNGRASSPRGVLGVRSFSPLDVKSIPTHESSKSVQSPEAQSGGYTRKYPREIIDLEAENPPDKERKRISVTKRGLPSQNAVLDTPSQPLHIPIRKRKRESPKCGDSVKRSGEQHAGNSNPKSSKDSHNIKNRKSGSSERPPPPLAAKGVVSAKGNGKQPTAASGIGEQKQKVQNIGTMKARKREGGTHATKSARTPNLCPLNANTVKTKTTVPLEGQPYVAQPAHTTDKVQQITRQSRSELESMPEVDQAAPKRLAELTAELLKDSAYDFEKLPQCPHQALAANEPRDRTVQESCSTATDGKARGSNELRNVAQETDRTLEKKVIKKKSPIPERDIRPDLSKLSASNPAFTPDKQARRNPSNTENREHLKMPEMTNTSVSGSSPTPDKQTQAKQPDYKSDEQVKRPEVSLTLEALESILRRHAKELRDDHEYITKARLARARRSAERRTTAVPQPFVQMQSPFAAMEVAELLPAKKQDSESSEITQSQDIWGGTKTKRISANYTKTVYTTCTTNVPLFTSYIDLRSNVLARNDQTLLTWPYFEDEQDREGLERELKDKYVMFVEDRPKVILRNEKIRQLEPYAKRSLTEIGCSLNDVLRYLLDPNPSTDGEFSSTALRNRHLDGGVDRTAEKWSLIFLTKLHPSSDSAVAAAGLACAVFLKVCGLSLWHIARRTLLSSADSSMNHAEDKHLGTLTCRVCQMHDCPHHGEITEEPDPEKPHWKAYEEELSSVDVSDSEEGKSMNHKTQINAGWLPRDRSYDDLKVTSDEVVYRVAYRVKELLGMDSDGQIGGDFNSRSSDPPYLPDDVLCSEQCFWKKSNRSNSVSGAWSAMDIAFLESVLPACATNRRGPCMIASTMGKPCVEIYTQMVSLSDKVFAADTSTKRPSAPKKSAAYWQMNSNTHMITERAPFYPCNHKGSCESVQCRCFRERITCEKSCACSTDCNRRFRGCNCAQVAHGRVCFQNEKCACFQLNRECDADLCGRCGAADVLDPENRYNDDAAKGKCTNVYIQKNLPKRTLLGESEVHGLGLYMGEPVKAHDYLGEYKGEILTKAEADRRSAIYIYQRTNYTFDLNKCQVIDSKRAGNKFRYINNSAVDSTINCYPKITLCNTVTRIGMFAKRDIEVGEELFFNYGYPKELTSNFSEKRSGANPQNPPNQDLTSGPSASNEARPRDKPLLGKKSASSKGGAQPIRPRLSDPSKSSWGTMKTARLETTPAGEGAGPVSRTVVETETAQEPARPARRARISAATGIRASASLLANQLRQEEGTEPEEVFEFKDDDADEDYEATSESEDESGAISVRSESDGGYSGDGQRSSRFPAPRTRTRNARKRKRTEDQGLPDLFEMLHGGSMIADPLGFLGALG